MRAIFKARVFACETCSRSLEALRWSTDPAPRCCDRPMAESSGRPGQTQNMLLDEWPCGKTFENGFAQPQTFYSRSAYRKALSENGLQVRGDGEESCTWISPETIKNAIALVSPRCSS